MENHGDWKNAEVLEIDGLLRPVRFQRKERSDFEVNFREVIKKLRTDDSLLGGNQGKFVSMDVLGRLRLRVDLKREAGEQTLLTRPDSVPFFVMENLSASLQSAWVTIQKE